MKLASLNVFLCLLCLSRFVVAQNSYDCGDAPIVPTLVDGSTSTMDVLVENSKEVKAFIARADEYLDCREKLYSRIIHKLQKEDLREEIKKVTKQRNDIGDEFNDQVAAYKRANP